MRENIIAISRLFRDKVELFNKDYAVILRQANKEDLIYMDPPYQGVCNGNDPRYFSDFSHTNFIDQLEFLNQKGIPFIVSYDGKTGSKSYGEFLPDKLNMIRKEINAGISSQHTLVGEKSETIESLYLSPSLVKKLKNSGRNPNSEFFLSDRTLFSN